MFKPWHLFSTSLYPRGQLEQLYPRPKMASSWGGRSVQFLSSGQGFCEQPSVSMLHLSPIFKLI